MSTIEDLVEKSRSRRLLPPPDACRLIREEANVTQAEVAAVIGASAQAVSQYESGKRRPRGDVLTRYVDLLAHLAAS